MSCPIQDEITQLKILRDETNAKLASQKNIEANIAKIEKEYGTDPKMYPMSIKQWLDSKHPDKGRIDIR